MKRLLLLGALSILGCAGSDKPAPAPAEAPKDHLTLTLNKDGSEIEAEADKGTLRITNTGTVPVSVCDDSQCMMLEPAKDMEFPVNRRVAYHLASTEDTEAKVEVKLNSEGKAGTLSVR